jgi:hypothetical protein
MQAEGTAVALGTVTPAAARHHRRSGGETWLCSGPDWPRPAQTGYGGCSRASSTPHQRRGRRGLRRVRTRSAERTTPATASVDGLTCGDGEPAGLRASLNRAPSGPPSATTHTFTAPDTADGEGGEHAQAPVPDGPGRYMRLARDRPALCDLDRCNDLDHGPAGGGAPGRLVPAVKVRGHGLGRSDAPFSRKGGGASLRS